VALPHAGGSASFFFPISAALSPSVEVLAVQYPGRQDRRSEASIESLLALAAEIAAVLPPWSDRPLGLFGHSMGAVVAFEVARQLEATGTVAPMHLFASGRRAPDHGANETVHRRDDDGVLAELRALQGTDPSLLIDEETVRMILPAVRSDYRAIETYEFRPGPMLRCPVTALVGDADPGVTIGQARAWGEQTAGPFELSVFRGGHFFLAGQPAGVADLVARRLGPAPEPERP
jgi:surfactin synthase thioesterase subunit